MSDLPKAVRTFMAANDKHLVVSGEVISLEEGGGRYTLENGRKYEMTAEECRLLPKPYPRWKL